MRITPRTLLATALASAIFGGCLGGVIATAASSQASGPSAQAAKTTVVRDVRGEAELGEIATLLKAVNVKLDGSTEAPIAGNILENVKQLLKDICQRSGTGIAPSGCY